MPALQKYKFVAVGQAFLAVGSQTGKLDGLIFTPVHLNQVPVHNIFDHFKSILISLSYLGSLVGADIERTLATHAVASSRVCGLCSPISEVPKYLLDM